MGGLGCRARYADRMEHGPKPMTDYAVDVRGLVKIYDGVRAVKS